MKISRFVPGVVLAALVVYGCSMQRKIARLQSGEEKVEINLPEEADFLPDQIAGSDFKVADTLVVRDDSGKDVILLKAVRDDETGEMVATDVLRAAIITARFRNKAERNGKVDLEFQIHVPKEMVDDNWEMTLNPDMFILEDSLRLESVVITGKDYRGEQLRGYERYQRFLDSIVKDSTVFVNRFLLERYIQRNIPELWRMKTDSSYVSEEQFLSYYGVSEQEAFDHYSRGWARTRNQRKVESSEARFAKWVPNPLRTEGVRLDTVLTDANGDFIYNYVETVTTRPKLRKVDVVLSGDIRDPRRRLYTIPTTDTLTFYISSLSAFAHDITKYKTEIVYRRAEANASYRILFDLGRAEVRTDLGNNASEIRRIKDNLAHLLQNDVFDLDSIVVTANSSPDGAYATNERLSRRRSESVTRYFENFMASYRDSLQRERGFQVDAEGRVHTEKVARIPFLSRSHAENWEDLDSYIASDASVSDALRAYYWKYRDTKDPDRRDWLLSRESIYTPVREQVYPTLRTVAFDFQLHRKGMVKDTVETTVVDEHYMEGLQALKDRDFEAAMEILGPYKDYNAAVAFLAMDRNYSALEILQKEKKTPEVNYMMAILKSRLGDVQGAVESYLSACRADSQYISRGNLDPEIAVLIKTYGLNSQEEGNQDE